MSSNNYLIESIIEQILLEESNTSTLSVVSERIFTYITEDTMKLFPSMIGKLSLTIHLIERIEEFEAALRIALRNNTAIDEDTLLEFTIILSHAYPYNDAVYDRERVVDEIVSNFNNVAEAIVNDASLYDNTESLVSAVNNRLPELIQAEQYDVVKFYFEKVFVPMIAAVLFGRDNDVILTNKYKQFLTITEDLLARIRSAKSKLNIHFNSGGIYEK